MLADRLEQLADETIGRPIGEADLAARLADTDQLRRGLFLVGGEHHAEGRDDDVEAAVLEGQRFGVGLAELDLESLGGGSLARLFEQSRHVVGGDHVAPAPRGGQRDVAVAGGDIEHLLSGAKIEGFAQLLADDLQRGADDGIIAGGPGALLAGLDARQIGLRRRRFGASRDSVSFMSNSLCSECGPR